MARKKSKMTWSDKDARAALEKYEHVVRMIARRLKPVASLGQALDEDDLCCEGRVAVLEALSTYQGFGIEESTWVRTRVRQRMIDAIRRLDLRSRDEVRLAVRHAAGETEGTPEEEKGRTVAARRLISLDSTIPDSEPLVTRIKDHHNRKADDLAQESARKRQLVEAMDKLPARQKQALEMGLFNGMSLKEIGNTMGISESRVCQLQKRAVQHLKKALSEEEIPTALAA